MDVQFNCEVTIYNKKFCFNILKVWMATLAAVVVTALMMWFLDRFSPYSARNNRQKYGPDARIFTLKESFWYAITQITPEGKYLYRNYFPIDIIELVSSPLICVGSIHFF